MSQKCYVIFCSETENLKTENGKSYCREHRGLTKEEPKTVKDCIKILETFLYCHFSSGCEHDDQYDEVIEVLKKLAKE